MTPVIANADAIKNMKEVERESIEKVQPLTFSFKSDTSQPL